MSDELKPCPKDECSNQPFWDWVNGITFLESISRTSAARFGWEAADRRNGEENAKLRADNERLRVLLGECETRLLEVSKTLYVIPGALTGSAMAVSGGKIYNLKDKVGEHVKLNVELIERSRSALQQKANQ